MQCQGGLMLSLLACEPFVEVLISNYSHLEWREREREREREMMKMVREILAEKRKGYRAWESWHVDRGYNIGPLHMTIKCEVEIKKTLICKVEKRWTAYYCRVNAAICM
jgi:hypothetical protein